MLATERVRRVLSTDSHVFRELISGIDTDAISYKRRQAMFTGGAARGVLPAVTLVVCTKRLAIERELAILEEVLESVAAMPTCEFVSRIPGTRASVLLELLPPIVHKAPVGIEPLRERHRAVHAGWIILRAARTTPSMALKLPPSVTNEATACIKAV